MQCRPEHTHNDGLKSKRRSFFLTAGHDLVSALLLHKTGLYLCMWEVKARTHLQDCSFETSPLQFTKLPSCLEKISSTQVKPHYHITGPPCSWTQSSNAQKWTPFTTVLITKEGNLQNGLCVPCPPSSGKPSDSLTQFLQESNAPKISENPDYDF